MEQSYQVKNTYIVRFGCQKDLLREITDFILSHQITLGHISLIGAVSSYHVGYYDSIAKKYISIEEERHMEILNGTGNISLKDGKPFAHVHLTLADDTGKAVGGHLFEGVKIFACEAVITEFDGAPLIRELDEDTGLTLWK